MPLYGPFTKADGTILNQYQVTAQGQWLATNPGTFADLGQGRQVQASAITERYQTVNNGPFMFRGVFVVLLPTAIPTRIPIPSGASVLVEGNNIYIVLA